MRRIAGLAALLALAGCFPLPYSFQDQPKGEAARLIQPPPARLDVNVTTSPPGGGSVFAKALAEALLAKEVPAEAIPPAKGDWQLQVRAAATAEGVVPHYAILDPAGHEMAHLDGAPIPAAAWAKGDPAALGAAAAAAAPEIADQLTGIDVAQKLADPKSLYHRVPEVAVLGVSGAPGDGNEALLRQMRLQLPQVGLLLTSDPASADFTIEGHVTEAPATAGNTRVEISWQMRDKAGHDLGRIIQMNDVPTGSLDGAWGDVALVIAQQAALGFKEVVNRQTHPPPGTLPPGTLPAGSPGAAPASAGTPPLAMPSPSAVSPAAAPSPPANPGPKGTAP